MAHKKNLAGILALTLIFGTALIGCPMTGDNNADPALAGTWRSSQFLDMGEGIQLVESDMVLKSDGTFEQFIVTPRTPVAKGTYTTSGNQLVRTVSAVYGSLPGALGGLIGDGLEMLVFEARYYTKNEYRDAYKAAYDNYFEENDFMGEMYEDMRNNVYSSIDVSINFIFKPQTLTYAISDNKLILTMTAETLRQLYKDMGIDIKELEDRGVIRDTDTVLTRQP